MSKKYRGKEICPCNSEITNSIKTESAQFDKPKICHPSLSNLNAKNTKYISIYFTSKNKTVCLFACLFAFCIFNTEFSPAV